MAKKKITIEDRKEDKKEMTKFQSCKIDGDYKLLYIGDICVGAIKVVGSKCSDEPKI